MTNSYRPSTVPLYRVDALTGCENLLGFSEWVVANHQAPKGHAFSLLSLDVRNFGEVNRALGAQKGDATLRWIGIVLCEETQVPVYRVGGDEFVAVFEQGNPSRHVSLGKTVYARLNRESAQIGLEVPVVSLAMIHYSGQEQISPSDIFVHLGASIFETKSRGQNSFQVFQAETINPDPNLAYLRWIAGHMIERLVVLGTMLDESNQLAYTDPVTGLPNMRSAERNLAEALEQARLQQQPLAVLLVDGDDLGSYNKISYAAGDEMIQQLSAILDEQLRPNDFLARWRIGDEFLILLPDTRCENARRVGVRLCQAVERISKSWSIPVTISIGISAFPDHGQNQSELIDAAEKANRDAKGEGKNRVVVAGAGCASEGTDSR